MRVKCLSATLGFFFLFMAADALAQIDNLTNMSAEWVRMSNRNAATDAGDIVVYNPAGLMGMSDGFHLNASNQTMFRNPKHSFEDPLGTGELTCFQSSPDWFIPNVYAAYKKDGWALFTGIFVPGGGVSIDYPDGSYTTRAIGAGLVANSGGAYTAVSNESMDAKSRYMAGVLGGALRLNDQVSVAAGIRYIDVHNSIDGNLTLTGGVAGPDTPDIPFTVDVNESGGGWGGVFGIMLTPVDKLNIAFHLETTVSINLETDIRDGDNISEDLGLFVDGDENPRDFPSMFGVGVSYQFTPALRGELDYNYFFQTMADWGKAPDGRDIADMAGDVWSIGAAVAYQVTPKLEASTGFLYTDHAWDDMDGYYNASTGALEVLYSDNINIGAGIAYEVLPGLKLNLAYSHTFWKDESIDTDLGTVETENSTNIVAVGIDLAY